MIDAGFRIASVLASHASSALRVAFALLALLAPHAHAETPSDARIRALTESLRCVVCQNQSLADSNAPLAADLRARIREQVERGASDDDVRAYMVHRYGDFVLYRPPMKAATLALWFGPLIAFGIGGMAMARCVLRARRTRRNTHAPPENAQR